VDRGNAEALSRLAADPSPPHGKAWKAMSETERALGKSGVSVPALGVGTTAGIRASRAKPA